MVDTPAEPKTTHVYDIVDGTKAVNGRVFFDTHGYADGIRCDTEGNVWCGFSGGEGEDGVAVFAPDGTLIGRILLPERCANVCFGGAQAEPAVHGGEPVGLCAVCRGAGRAGRIAALARVPSPWLRASSAECGCPGP